MDGKYLASAGDQETPPPADWVNIVSSSAVGGDRSVLVWDIGAGSQLHKYTGHTDTICQLAFSRDGTLLASGLCNLY